MPRCDSAESAGAFQRIVPFDGRNNAVEVPIDSGYQPLDWD